MQASWVTFLFFRMSMMVRFWLLSKRYFPIKSFPNQLLVTEMLWKHDASFQIIKLDELQSFSSKQVIICTAVTVRNRWDRLKSARLKKQETLQKYSTDTLKFHPSLLSLLCRLC